MRPSKAFVVGVTQGFAIVIIDGHYIREQVAGKNIAEIKEEVDEAESVACARGCSQDASFIWHDEAVRYNGLADQQINRWEYASDGSKKRELM